jgi:hypothetical protein
MVVEDHDEATYAKILAAAEEIRAMARHRPAQAAAMFAQARHLFELAEQMRHDLRRRQGVDAPGRPVNPRADRATDGASVGDGVWVTDSAE